MSKRSTSRGQKLVATGHNAIEIKRDIDRAVARAALMLTTEAMIAGDGGS